MTPAARSKVPQYIADLQALTDEQLWMELGNFRPDVPLAGRYSEELQRRASRATIKAASATRFAAWVAAVSAGLSAIAIIVAAGISVWTENHIDPERPSEPQAVYIIPPPDP